LRGKQSYQSIIPKDGSDFDYNQLPDRTLGFFAYYHLIQSENKIHKSDKEKHFELSLKISSIGIKRRESMTKYVLFEYFIQRNKLTKEIVKYYKNAVDNGNNIAAICLAEYYKEGKNNKEKALWYYLISNVPNEMIPNEIKMSDKELRFDAVSILFPFIHKIFVQLKNKIFELENKIKELEYAPGGVRYQEAYQDFVYRINN
jgi:hypothetical protein